MFYRLKKGKLRELIIKAITKAGSERKLSREIGISNGRIYSFKSEITNLSEEYAKKLCNYLNMDMKKLDYEKIFSDNWGQIKGGKIGGKRSQELQKKRLGNDKYIQNKREIGKKVIRKLWKKYGKELTRRAVMKKINNREVESYKLEQKNMSFFTNNKVLLNVNKIEFSRTDQLKNIRLPTEMTEYLAEETGIHLGDGCLSFKRHYFSVKCSKKEEKYITHYLFNLYKKIYNIDLRLRKLPSVSGFEIYSSAIFNFKNKVIGIPYGNKVGKLEVPRSILDTRNKKIYCSFIRGLFDTDGCVYMRNKKYPIISITIKSRNLMEQLKEMFKKLGFIPSLYKWTITVNGPTMLKKWIKEIGSNNPKNIAKLKRASSIVDST